MKTLKLIFYTVDIFVAGYGFGIDNHPLFITGLVCATIVFFQRTNHDNE